MKSLTIITSNDVTTGVCHTSVVCKVYHSARYFTLNVSNWPTLTTTKAMNKTLEVAGIKGVVKRSKGQLIFIYNDKTYDLGSEDVEHRFFIDLNDAA